MFLLHLLALSVAEEKSMLLLLTFFLVAFPLQLECL